ncbi:DNA topoisomerase 3-alpha, partial [Bienertia sinuspersici]
MASQNSGGSLYLSGVRSRSRSSVPPMKCYHDDIATIRTVRMNCPTQGKRFYGCSHYLWADEVNNIMELQMLAIEKDTKISELECERDVAELAIENTQKGHAMESVKANKKLCIMLFMSWIRWLEA